MKSSDYILTRQTQWVGNHGLTLTGSKGNQDRAAYTPDLDANLFEPLTPLTRANFKHVDKGNFTGSPAKIQYHQS